jgi:cobalamin biosynthesis protein CobD/CbiB
MRSLTLEKARRRAIVVGVLALTLILAWPLAVIWALNTLFGLAIGYTISNWLAVMILFATLGIGTVRYKQK